MNANQLAVVIEKLFSSLTPHLNDFDSSKEFISITSAASTSSNQKPLSQKQLHRERLGVLQYAFQLVNSTPHIFHYTKETQIGGRCVNTLLHFVDCAAKSMRENGSQSVALLGIACQVLAKLLVINFEVQSSKEFTSTCRKALRQFGGIISYWNEQKSSLNNTTFNVALIELLSVFVQNSVNLTAQDTELIEKGAVYGLMSLKNNSEANMLCSGTVYALICAFDHKDPTQKHKEVVKNMITALNSLMEECYKFVIADHDPRQAMTGSNIISTTGTAHRQTEVSPYIRPLLKRKNPISSLQFKKLFRSFSHCLQRCLTIPFPFLIELNLKRVMTLVSNAAMIDSSLKLFDSSSVKKIITLKSVSDVTPVIHREAMKTLSALILTAKGALLPHVNSISIILLQEFNHWAVLDEKPLESIEVYKEVVRCVTFALDNFGPCLSQSFSQQILPSIHKMLLSFYNTTMKYELDKDVNKDSAIQSLENFNVTNKKSNKRKRGNQTEDSNPTSLPVKLQHQYLTLKLLQHVLPSSQVNASLDTLSALIDIVTCLISSLQIFHAHRFTVFQNPNSQGLNQIFSGVVAEQYQALHTCLLSGSAINTQSPFLPAAINLYRKGIQTCIPAIVSICSEALQVSESFLHPRSAPLHTPSGESVSIQMSKMLERERAVTKMLTATDMDEESSSDEEMEDVPVQKKKQPVKQTKKVASKKVEDDMEVDFEDAVHNVNEQIVQIKKNHTPKRNVPEQKKQQQVKEQSSSDESSDDEEEAEVKRPVKKQQQQEQQPVPVSKPSVTKPTVADSDEEEEEEPLNLRKTLTKQQIEENIESAFDKNVSDSEDSDNDDLDFELKDDEVDTPTSKPDLDNLQLDFTTI
jgi:hypothetical protein